MVPVSGPAIPYPGRLASPFRVSIDAHSVNFLCLFILKDGLGKRTNMFRKILYLQSYARRATGFFIGQGRFSETRAQFLFFQVSIGKLGPA